MLLWCNTWVRLCLCALHKSRSRLLGEESTDTIDEKNCNIMVKHNVKEKRGKVLFCPDLLCETAPLTSLDFIAGMQR